MDLSELMSEDAASQAVKLPSDDALQEVGALANRQLELEALLKEKQNELAELEQQLVDVSEFRLPNALEKAGLSRVDLTDGSVVTVNEDVYAGITEEHRGACYEWLEATQNDGIIKNNVKLAFGKGQDAEAAELTNLLTEKGYSFTNVRGVHPQTLKAFIRKQMEDGLPIPLDLFSVHIKRIAKVQLPKVRR
jgi:hypothetical protein